MFGAKNLLLAHGHVSGPRAFDASGGAGLPYAAASHGAYSSNGTALSWPHTVSGNAIIAAVTGYGSGGYSPWTRHVAIGSGQVTFDSSAIAEGTLNSSGLTWTQAVSASANCLVVGVGVYYASGDRSGVTSSSLVCGPGNTAMTLLGYVNANNTTTFGWIELWGLQGGSVPTGGSVSFTYKESISASYPAATVVSASYIGVGSIGSAVTNYGNSTTMATPTVSSAMGDVVVAVSGAWGKTVTNPTGTQRNVEPASGNASYVTAHLQDCPGAASTVMQATIPSFAWGCVAVDLVPSAFTSVALTQLGVVNGNNNTSQGWAELWGLQGVSVPQGAQTLFVTETNSSNLSYLIGTSVSYSGVTGFGSGVINYGTAGTITTGAVSSATGHIVVAALCQLLGTLTSPSGTVRFGPYPASGGLSVSLLVTDAPGAASVTQTCSGGSNWAACAVDVQ